MTDALRPSMLVTLFEDVRPMALSGLASGFVAAVALLRLHELWCAIWLVVDVALLAARLAIARAYVVERNAGRDRAEYWAMHYAPVSLLACFVLGLGAMGCVDAADVELGTLAVMIAGGVFGGTIAGSGGFAVQGGGTQTLTGANTYTGGTTIGSGSTLALS
ncbi:GGDEF domain-containing protein, partial [Burkholderia multivorans]